MEFHEIANLFPHMDDARISELAADIKANGLRIPIQIYEGKILDGRNRFRACEMAGIEPLYENVTCENPYRLVWSLNGNRRDLTDIQRGLIFLKCDEAAAVMEAAKAEAEKARREGIAEAVATQERNELGMYSPDGRNRSAHPDRPDSPGRKKRERDDSKRATSAVAQHAGVSRATMEKVYKIKKTGTENTEAVINGKAKPTEVLRQDRNKKKLEKLKALPKGKWHIIYADPPWEYNDKRETQDKRESTAAADHYPTMTNAQVKALDIRRMAAGDCVLFLWATFPLLPEALGVVKAWGFTYKTAFVWDKGRGSFGHYHDASAEILILATIGSGTPQVDKREKQIQKFNRGRHSSKPREWRDMIDRLYPVGPGIELFSRGKAEGRWDVWGAEAND